MRPSLWTIDCEQSLIFLKVTGVARANREKRGRRRFPRTPFSFWINAVTVTEKLTVIREKVDCKQFSEQEFFCFKVESASCFNGESQHAQSCESKRAFFRRVRRKEEKRRFGRCGGKS